MKEQEPSNLVQADVNDVLDNLTASVASLTRQLAISQSQVLTLQRRLKELEAKTK
ncbi:hypothetical protein [Bifidobacterium olomucense]|uniref:Uncharacterized protein n=1 Tax=Bifidobacterium olomucense TaxID=2675324 RepID=A0A7Y0HXH1_9BIFI|nr:hypothetical protein [Bifidobacterium sp. DSM 109959]NMM99391.1 hypothetical protein [Bifidobacterium sp. DSM 109959]